MENENTLIDLSSFGLSEKELFAKVDNSTLENEKITAPRYSYWKSVFRVFFRNKVNIVALILLGVIVVFAYLYPLITGYNPEAALMENINDAGAKNLAPSAAISYFGFSLKYVFGTGSSGEALWDTIWYGSSISISLAFVCAAINMGIGIIIGAIWGFSKKVDLVMTEVYNIIGNIPYVLLISVLVMVLTASFWTMVFALCITGWLGIAYFIRTQVIIIRDREYNLASRCLGTPMLRLTMKNILPFMTSIIVTLLAEEIPSFISYEVFLSYLGIGLKDMSLGKILSQYEVNMFTAGRQYQFWIPVAIASIITIVLYLVGQNLGDASDPRTHM